MAAYKIKNVMQGFAKSRLGDQRTMETAPTTRQ